MRKTLIHILISTTLVLPVLVYADIGLQNPINVNSISELILIVTRVVRYIAIPFVVLAIMYAGFDYIWASVSGKVSSDQHSRLKWIIIGAFILLSSELIALVMRNTINSLTK